jgi:pimeloyl-ACP methyl ester carboxylesterase
MPKYRIRDIHLYYETTGQGQPLLLLHGLGSSTRDWEAQVPFFTKQYQVITLDVRGHGQSDKPPGPYTIPLFARDTAELLQSLNLAPAHVVGISMGGMIALQLVIDNPQLVKSLVIVNSGPELVPRTFKERLQIWQRLLIVRLLGMRKMGEVLSTRLFPKPEQEAIRQQFVERWAENDQRAYLDSLRALIGWSVTDHLPGIRCPVAVIAADADYTPVSAKETYVRKIPGATLQVIPDSRHATPIDQPELFNTAVMDFLNTQRS